MTKRGAKSRTTIAGYTLTWAELTVLNQMREYLSLLKPPRTVHLAEIFPGSENAKRYCARQLAEVGVLAACQIEFSNDSVTTKGHAL